MIKLRLISEYWTYRTSFGLIRVSAVAAIMGKLQHGEGGDTTETVSVAQEEVFQISKSQINKAKKKAKKKRLRDNELRERKKVWSLRM